MLNAKKLKLLREASSWTPTQMLQALAKEQGTFCSQSELSRYESGHTKSCSVTLLLALAKLYDVEPEDLLC